MDTNPASRLACSPPKSVFFGIIGNGHTCALVGPQGTIEWFCIPRFDSGFVFGRLIDREGGSWAIIPESKASLVWSQRYLPDTAILETTATTTTGIPMIQITDWMPWGIPEIRRHIEVLQPDVVLKIVLHPTFDYRRRPHTWSFPALSAVPSHCSASTHSAAPSQFSGLS